MLLYFFIAFALFIYICYNSFMLDGNLSNLNNFSKVNPYSKIGIANAMPTNNIRIVESANQNSRSKEYVQKQNIREVYSKNLSPSSSFSTEKFLKSKSILTPVYVHNEAKTKYEMVSKIPMEKKELNSQVDLFA
ncbi:MAG: hypothetical protein CBE11_02870 [Rickettsiales bacterium TMED251]|nr:MAG: hypothetical protein CBE11_02870 [Rickettsiales bacterium TMED251]